MSLFCTKNLIILLVGLIGFFPYMPLVHADTKEVSLSESHHCTSHEDKVPHSGDHDMNFCLDTINSTALLHNWVFSEILEPASLFSFIFSYGDDYNYLEQKALIKILPHTLDPPSFSSENLIGIIKITS